MNFLPVRRFVADTFKISSRCFSSTTPLVDVKVDASNGCAVVTMQKAPVNSLSLEMICSLTESLARLETDKCRGFILTSGLPKIFSAGLDIREMYQPEEARLREFWTALQALWLKLYGSKMASIALINGHSPAGGCLLAMCCDYRVMVGGKFAIGLNETQLGIVAPFWFKDTMVNTIGTRQAELALMLGRMFSTDEALQIGMIDKVAADPQAALELAQSQLQALVKIPAQARYLSKLSVREDALKKLAGRMAADTDNFVAFATSAPVQKGLGLYLASLSKKA